MTVNICSVWRCPFWPGADEQGLNIIFFPVRRCMTDCIVKMMDWALLNVMTNLSRIERLLKEFLV